MYFPRKYAGGGPLFFALMLFGMPILAFAVAMPHGYQIFALIAFVVSFAPVIAISNRAGVLNRRHSKGDYRPHVRYVDAAILAIWNLGWMIAAFCFWTISLS